MIVSNFLKQQAQANNFTIFDTIYGEIQLSNPQCRITQSSGSTYGIWIELNNNNIKSALMSDLKKCGKNVNPNSNAIHLDWYPLYWGRDIHPGSRIKAHVNTSSNTGGLNLSQLNLSENYHIKYGVILVSDYSKFELFLHQNFPPIVLSSSTPGKVSTASILH